MKRLLGILLSLCLLSGCGANTAPSTGSTQEPPASSAAEPLPVGAAAYRVETEVLEDSVKAEDGTLLYEYRDELPHLMAYAADGALIPEGDATTVAFNAAFDQWREDVDNQELVEGAKSDYAFRLEDNLGWTNYAESFTYSLYQTDRLISVLGETYSYTGGAHPNTAYAAWNFDLEEGRFIPLDQLGKDGQFQTAVGDEIVRQMEERAKELDVPVDAMYWNDYKSIAAQWPNYAVSFGEADMTVTFSPYDVASYAAGSQTFSISYRFLEPYLGDYGKTLLGLMK